MSERFGPLEYKLLSTGYHYVRAARFAHLFAQWPIGGAVQISHNGELSESDERLFCDECARVAELNGATMNTETKAASFGADSFRTHGEIQAASFAEDEPGDYRAAVLRDYIAAGIAEMYRAQFSHDNGANK